MRPRISRIATAVVGAALAAALAVGCGGGGSSSSTSAAAQGAATTSTAVASTGGGAATVAVADNPKVGSILVDAQGRTLYLFEKDESTESYCNGNCAKVWPPYTTKGAPKAGNGATASKLGTLKRDDGSTQVTYNGSPLYLYVSDKKAGDAKGNELDQFGAEWYAMQPNGAKAESHGGSGENSGGSSSGGGSGGGGYSY